MSRTNKGIFYGTGAAEGIPNPFCGCYLCEYARTHGGKDIRTRSMFRVSEKVMIDMGADSFVQAAKYGDFKNLEHVLITHTHEDHFAYMMLSVRKMATHRPVKTLHFYFTDRAYELVGLMRENRAFMKGALPQMEADGIVEFHRLNYGETYEVDDCKVIPLKGHHFGNMQEKCANYLIMLPDGKRLYYGLDTGAYEEETLDCLKKEKLDILISECTYGNVEDTYPDPGHLSLTTCVKMIEKLRAQGSLKEECRIYLTHINHVHTAYHEKLQELVDQYRLPYPCTVAYDGMEIDL